MPCRKLILHAFTVTLAAAAALSQQSQPAPTAPLTAEEILDRSVKARGGIAALDSISTIYAKGYTLDRHGKRTEFESYKKMPHKFLLVRTESNKKIVKTGFNGSDLWVRNNDERARSLPSEFQYDARNAAEFFLIHWRNGTKKTELWGTEQVNGRKTYGVRILPHKGRPFELYFDAETFILLREDGTTPAWGGGFDPGEVYFSNFRVVDGIVISCRTDFVLHGGTLNKQSGHAASIATEVRLNVPMDDSMFEKPK